jgi:glycosyltransferase involved in cell wall biosynthesis
VLDVIIGIFAKDLNLPGGHDRVIISMIDCMKKRGDKVLLMCRRRLRQDAINSFWGENVSVDKQIIFPVSIPEVPLFGTYWNSIAPSLLRHHCDLLIDASTNDLVKRVDISYVHFPDYYVSMLERIRASNIWRFYYAPYIHRVKRIQKELSNRIVMTNSHYTADLIRSIWGFSPVLLYPPVHVDQLAELKGDDRRKNNVVTVSLFSPEKRLELIPRVAEKVAADFKIIGFLEKQHRRNFENLNKLTESLHVEGRVKLLANATHETKFAALRNAKVYLHAMHNEQFGIAIAEAMSCGCIPVVHDSGGPKEFVPKEWRYKNDDEAIQKTKEALNLWSPELAQEMISISLKFTNDAFQSNFLRILDRYGLT